MYVTPTEYLELLGEIDKALTRFGGKPAEEGFDLEIYEELRRVRELLVRAKRDSTDPNVRRDSRNPLGST